MDAQTSAVKTAAVEIRRGLDKPFSEPNSNQDSKVTTLLYKDYVGPYLKRTRFLFYRRTFTSLIAFRTLFPLWVIEKYFRPSFI